jgi:membrane fusion protein, copper/silver efflux system
MKKISYIALFIIVVACAFFAGSRYGHPNAAPYSASDRRVLYYVDPMHPAYKSDKPGVAPDCGMQLEAVYADDARELGSPRDSMQISDAKQQMFGVRVSAVEKASESHDIRLLGRVAPDESRIYKLNAGIEGYIQDVSPITTGGQVRKNELLASFAAPNATMVIQTFLLNLGAEDRFKKSAADGSPEAQNLGATASNLQQRNQQLQNLGMSQLQMDEIRRSRQIPETIKILSPANGFVLDRNVTPGQKFERGAEWFRIANLDRVWILADVFEADAKYLHAGSQAFISLPQQNRKLAARVSDILPQFDTSTRTLKVRLELDNPGYLLRPGMFVDVELPVTLSSTVVVPAEAVVDSGMSQTVFVEREPGIFEPRGVKTGWRFEDKIEVVSGLQPGERIVTSGNFLLGSESRLENASGVLQERRESVPIQRAQNSKAGQAGMAKDPSCGMEVEINAASRAGRQSDYADSRYYFCSDSCKRKFDANPQEQLKKANSSPVSGSPSKVTGISTSSQTGSRHG